MSFGPISGSGGLSTGAVTTTHILDGTIAQGDVENGYVALSGAQTVAGVKTFSSPQVLSLTNYAPGALGTQGDATEISAPTSVVNSGGSAESLKFLSTLAVGTVIWLHNTTTSYKRLFPETGSTINQEAANAAVGIAPAHGTGANIVSVYYCFKSSATSWTVRALDAYAGAVSGVGATYTRNNAGYSQYTNATLLFGATNGIQFDNSVRNVQGFAIGGASSAAGTTSVAATVAYHGVTGAAGGTITLPAVASVNTGHIIAIKDEGGNAGAVPITVTGATTELVDNGDGTIAANYGSLTVVMRNAQWNII